VWQAPCMAHCCHCDARTTRCARLHVRLTHTITTTPLWNDCTLSPNTNAKLADKGRARALVCVCLCVCLCACVCVCADVCMHDAQNTTHHTHPSRGRGFVPPHP
jgi:hypothetical protein